MGRTLYATLLLGSVGLTCGRNNLILLHNAYYTLHYLQIHHHSILLLFFLQPLQTDYLLQEGIQQKVS